MSYARVSFFVHAYQAITLYSVVIAYTLFQSFKKNSYTYQHDLLIFFSAGSLKRLTQLTITITESEFFRLVV